MWPASPSKTPCEHSATRSHTSGSRSDQPISLERSPREIACRALRRTAFNARGFVEVDAPVCLEKSPPVFKNQHCDRVSRTGHGPAAPQCMSFLSVFLLQISPSNCRDPRPLRRGGRRRSFVPWRLPVIFREIDRAFRSSEGTQKRIHARSLRLRRISSDFDQQGSYYNIRLSDE